MAKPTLFLIDGSGYIFRAYYAVRRLTTSAGFSTNAVFGFTNMLLRVLREHQPEHIGIVFDAGGKNFRHEMFPDYKANRPPPPEDLPPQLPLINDVVDAFQIRQFRIKGVEADDVIGTIARKAARDGVDVRIITGDKDFMQLVDDRIFLIDELRLQRATTENAVVDRDEVIRKFGVPPEHVIDILGLAGDTSDNVPGVKGIGEKTAKELVLAYGSVDEILNHAGEITQKARRERLQTQADAARLSRDLVTIKTDVDVEYTLDNFRYDGPNRDALRTIFTELEFKRLLDDQILKVTNPEAGVGRGSTGKRIEAPVRAQGDLFASSSSPSSSPSEASDVEVSDDVHERAPQPLVHDAYTIVATTSALTAFGATLRVHDDDRAPLGLSLVVDPRTDGPDRIVALGLSVDGGAPTVIDFTSPNAPTIDDAVRVLNTTLSKSAVSLEDAKSSLRVLWGNGFTTPSTLLDPAVASYLIDPEANGHDLVSLAERRQNAKAMRDDEVRGKGKSATSFENADRARVHAVVGERAALAASLYPGLRRDLEQSEMASLFDDIEMPLARVLADMERTGVLIDTERLGRMSAEFERDLIDVEARAHDAAGEAFNLQSPSQISEILFTKLGLSPSKKTKTGLSTDASVLEELKSDHPLPGLILEHRELAKLKGTYIDALPRLVRTDTGRIHTCFHQTVAATGRLSSSDPNLQNIPVRSAAGRRIREAFIAPKGRSLISLDYSQIELRLLAHVSGDAVLIDTFEKNEDVHQRTASEIFSVKIDDVTREQRTSAKAINFGLLYGMGVHRLAGELGVKRSEAKEFLDRYFERYAGIAAWKNEALQSANHEGAVRTLFGRRRMLPQLSSQNRGEVALGERLAINTPIQGSAADLVKRAMVDTHTYLERDVPTARLLLQVHDELLIEADNADLEVVTREVKTLMENAARLRVPLIVDANFGASWADIH